MNIEKSDKIEGYVKFSVGEIGIHAYQDTANKRYVTTYWDALDICSAYEKDGLRMPTVSEAAEIIRSNVLNDDELHKFISIGYAGLLCWTSDYGAIESFPDSHEFKLRQNASGLGQDTPIWFVETK